MEDIRTFLLYLIGLVGLIGASILYANQGEAPGLGPLPARATPTKILQAAPPSAVARLKPCASLTYGLISNSVAGVPSTATNSDDGLLSISGTIYASDGATPLPGVLIEVWGAMSIDDYESYFYRTQIQTGASGYYTYRMVKPSPDHPLSIRYRISYQDRCLLSMYLEVITESLLRPSMVSDNDPLFPLSTKSPVAQFREARPVLHGPVDIVLPVPPPMP